MVVWSFVWCPHQEFSLTFVRCEMLVLEEKLCVTRITNLSSNYNGKETYKKRSVTDLFLYVSPPGIEPGAVA